MTLRGITWDHPRGRDALEAAATEAREAGALDLEWSAHPLEGFESHPIDDLAQNYELIVLDHPHLGEALEHGSLQPLDAVVGAADIERWSHQAVGPSFDSYSVDGYQWAVPLDAAAQVAVHDARLLATPPATWAEVADLAGSAPVALSLAGPHAFLTFASLCVALGEPPAQHPSSSSRPVDFGPRTSSEGPKSLDREEGALVSDETAGRVLELMRGIGERVPEGTAELNPIGLLERMSTVGDIAYCPLVYGYVTYSSKSIRFADAPVAVPAGRHGSTIGGTGLAVSARTEVTPELVAHIRHLMDPETQRGFIPRHAGQPSNRAAWLDDEVNRESADFYRSTLATLDDSWVRPRFGGYIPFQTAASAIVREIVAGELGIEPGIRRLNEAFAAAPTDGHAAADASVPTRSTAERV
ncbi:hypothetical protein [Herbiconiux sp. YIM B11900]|uniref:hypothetical protein n=1 Tax=Herbiconiux sp. YIM B11900 TaxID=3404131 RepID=UPI003F82B497